MRTVVIAVKNGKAAVAGENGSMCYIEDKGYQTGQILELDEGVFGAEQGNGLKLVNGLRDNVYHFVRRNISGLAAALVLAAITGGIFVYATPVKTVKYYSLPEANYTLNIFDRVIDVSFVESENLTVSGELIWEISGRTVEEAMEITREAMEEDVQSDDGKTDSDSIIRELPGNEKEKESTPPLEQQSMPEETKPESQDIEKSGEKPEIIDRAEPPESGNNKPAGDVNANKGQQPDNSGQQQPVNPPVDNKGINNPQAPQGGKPDMPSGSGKGEGAEPDRPRQEDVQPPPADPSASEGMPAKEDRPPEGSFPMEEGPPFDEQAPSEFDPSGAGEPPSEEPPSPDNPGPDAPPPHEQH